MGDPHGRAPYLRTTADGWLQAVSPEFANLLDRRSETLRGLNWLDLVHPDDIAEARGKWHALSDSIADVTTEVRMWTGQKRWLGLALALHTGADGAITIAVIDHDSDPFADLDVPRQRAATRSLIGGDEAPMIEIDPEGHTTFVAGDWSTLIGEADGGPEALELLLEHTGLSDVVVEAMGDAIDHERSSDFELPGQGRWIRVLPIPCPRRRGVNNVLIGLAERPAARPEVRPLTFGAPTQLALPQGPAPDSMPVADDAEPEPPPATTSVRDRVAAGLSDARRRLSSVEMSSGELATVAAVAVLALVFRVWDLTGVPTGFHGDEAIFGQEGQRVLESGSIGVYTGSALGQPTAPFYLGAITVGLFGPTVWATRIVAAIAGVLTVMAVYAVVRPRLGHRVAVASALALAMLTWAIHFSRIAFGVAWWPLIVLLAIAAVDRAGRASDGRSWFIAGAVSAFGVYVYNSHWLFGVAVAVFMSIWLLWPHGGKRNTALSNLIWGPVGALVVLLPMLNYARDDANGYFNHFESVSRRNTDEWNEAGFGTQARLVAEWYLDAWNNLLFSPQGDGVDASGVIGQVPLVFTVLAVFGLFELLRRHRTAFVGLALVTLIVLPLGPALTVDGISRREYAIAPIIAILAGAGAIWLHDLIARTELPFTGRAAMTLLAAVAFFTSVVPYFTDFRNSGRQKWVFAEELTMSVDAVQHAERDGPVFVNWYSARHYYDYPTLDFLLDGTGGVDRTPLHEGFVENPSLDLHPDTDADQLFVLVGDYGRQLDALRERYPDGRVVAEYSGPLVTAYEVPAG